MEDRAEMVAFLPKLTQLIRDGKLRPNRIKLWNGGLDAIQEGLDYMRQGKLSGEKIVYRICESSTVDG
ncbi:hypothetical protein M422DRAFT_35168 [Sphaerobolus stellatus SS14]|nr:hypothetical protein M422DRAFT_35168 [Sphaerobolus stellatus SS14]